MHSYHRPKTQQCKDRNRTVFQKVVLLKLLYKTNYPVTLILCGHCCYVAIVQRTNYKRTNDGVPGYDSAGMRCSSLSFCFE